MADELVESVKFVATGLPEVTSAVGELTKSIESARRGQEGWADALSNSGFRKSLVELDSLTRKVNDHKAQLIASHRATERLTAARGGDYLRGYREEIVLRERLTRANQLERAQRLTADRQQFSRGDPVSRARTDLRNQLGEGQLARDRERAALAARLQLSAAQELSLARDAYALEQMRAKVAERADKARLAAMPVAQRLADPVKAVAIADSALTAARKRAEAEADVTRQTAMRAGHERQARMEQLRGGGGLREAQERLRTTREEAALARQVRANDLEARYGRTGGRIAGMLESRAAAGFGGALAGVGGYGLHLARQGYAGTVEGNVLDLQRQRLARNIGGGFKPASDAYTRALDIANRFHEQQSPGGQSLEAAGITAAGAAGSLLSANYLKQKITGTGLQSWLPSWARASEAAPGRFGAAGRLVGRAALPVAAIAETYGVYSDAQERGGGSQGWGDAAKSYLASSNRHIFNAAGWVTRQLGYRTDPEGMGDAYLRKLAPPGGGDKPGSRSRLTLNDSGYEELGAGRDRAQIALLANSLPNQTGNDAPPWLNAFFDRLERVLLTQKEQQTPGVERKPPDS